MLDAILGKPLPFNMRALAEYKIPDDGRLFVRRTTPRWTTLRQHETQEAYLRSTMRFNVVPSGRRCLQVGTLVATPYGPRPIEDLKIGDAVIGFDENGAHITTVTAIWDNGIQYVFPFGNHYKIYLCGTDDHKLWAVNEWDLKRGSGEYKRLPLSKLTKRHRIRRQYADDLIQGGLVHFEQAYSLAAFLGNGRCTLGKGSTGARLKHLYISCADHTVPKKVAGMLDCPYEKLHESNFSYKIENAADKIPLYDAWCLGRKAHEKIADWAIVDTWDRASCLAFLAGALDTDGSIHFKTPDKKQVVISLSMQAESVVSVCAQIIFKYFQETVHIGQDKRGKYKNGPCHTFSISGNLLVRRILKALSPYMLKQIDIYRLENRNVLPDRIGLAKQGIPYKAHTWDITVANESNLYILHEGGIVTSNSGKTEIAKRRIVIKALARCLDKSPQYHTGRFFCAAPTRDQAKRIYWQDLKALIPKVHLESKPRETDLIIPLRNNVELHVIGLDKPERFEGSPWDYGVLDEYGNMKSEAWEQNVLPALADRQGGCDLIGVPEGRNHYYERYLEALANKSGKWAAFHWKSAEILPDTEIAMFRAMMDELSFRQEFEGDFVNFAGQAYYPFNETEHVRTLFYDPQAPLVICFDFNVSPGVAVIAQEQVIPGAFEWIPNPGKYPLTPRGWTRAVKENGLVRVPVVGTGIIGEVYIKANSNTPAICNRLIKDWGREGRNHQGQIHIYGDATGGAKGTAKVDGSDWELIEQAMYGYFGSERIFMEVPASNPSERARINAVNARLKSLDGTTRLAVDPSCRMMIKDFEGTRLLDGGSGEIDKKKDRMLSHLCFAGDTMLNGDQMQNLPASGMVDTFFRAAPYRDNVQRGMAELIQLTFNDGWTLRVTPGHAIMTQLGWKQAKDCLNLHGYFINADCTGAEFWTPHRPYSLLWTTDFDNNCLEKIGLTPDMTRFSVQELVLSQMVEFDTLPRPCAETERAGIALKRVVQIDHLTGLYPVWCPTVTAGHFVLDSGLVVSNSDAIGYYISRAHPLVDDSIEELDVSGRY